MVKKFRTEVSKVKTSISNFFFPRLPTKVTTIRNKHVHRGTSSSLLLLWLPSKKTPSQSGGKTASNKEWRQTLGLLCSSQVYVHPPCTASCRDTPASPPLGCMYTLVVQLQIHRMPLGCMYTPVVQLDMHPASLTVRRTSAVVYTPEQASSQVYVHRRPAASRTYSTGTSELFVYRQLSL